MPSMMKVGGLRMPPYLAGGGSTLAAPAEVMMINQGGPNNDVNSNPSASNGSYIAIQWSPVAGATGYNIYRSTNGGAFSLYASNVQPKTFTASSSATTLTVTSDGTGGQIIPGVRYNDTAGVLQETQINFRYGTSSTTGTGGTGTYVLNRSQTVTSRIWTACYYVDTGATNGVHAATDAPGTIYDYNVSTLNGAAEGPQSTNMVMWGYRNGFSNWQESELSFGPPFPNSIYNSTNGSPQGGPFCLEYTVNGGLQIAIGNPQCPQWQAEIGWAKYLIFDFNPGASYTGWGLPNTGIVKHVPTGDVFGVAPQIDSLLTYAQGAVAANTWVQCKDPLTVLGNNKNTFTGSISGSTCTVTGMGSGLWGSPGTFDNSGYVTGTGIPTPCWVQDHLSGSGTGIGTWQLYGPGNVPISVTASSDGTWTWQGTQLYKFVIYNGGGPGQQVYLNNIGFSRN